MDSLRVNSEDVHHSTDIDRADGTSGSSDPALRRRTPGRRGDTRFPTPVAFVPEKRPGVCQSSPDMKAHKVPKVTPSDFSPCLADEGEVIAEGGRFVWESLVPRLIHPLKLAIIEALLAAGRPVAPSDLASILEETPRCVRYHCGHMAESGVLRLHPGEQDDEEPTYFFPPPPQGFSPATSIDPVGRE
jgi:dihydrofolate reductase